MTTKAMSESESPAVSVVIPTFNRSRLVGRAIESALGQTGVELEVVVVDDASSDDTLDVISSIGDARVRVIGHTVNRGGSAARNTGIRAARAPYVAFLDSDDVWLPNKLEQQVAILDSQPEVGLVYCGHYGAFDDVDGLTEPSIDFRNGDVYSDLLGGWCPHGNSLTLVRRELLIQVGLFDEQLSGFQDYDLWLRLAAVSQFDSIAQRLVVKHAHSGPQLTTDSSKRDLALRLFMNKWGGRMDAQHGEGAAAAVYSYHNQHILRTAVISTFSSGRRKEAWSSYGLFLRQRADSGLSTKSAFEAASLLPGLLLGARAHRLVRRLFRARVGTVREMSE